MTEIQKLAKIKVLKDMFEEYELLAKYNGGIDYDRWKALEMAIQALSQEPKTGHCKECKYFCELPYHIDILGKCIRHTGFCPGGDWYCADFEPQESEDEE